jgi:hypothetical protein
MENKSHSISDVAIGDFHQKDYQSVVEYKAFAFLADQTKTTFNYEVKRVRAVWDSGLSIPGTDRRGGWRCPPGVRFGGQITDRFGRNCGWGIARRIANALTNVGEMVEGRDDERRGRRTAKRNARMVRRLARDEEGGLLERGARGIADVLDGGEVSTPTPTPRVPDTDIPEVDAPSVPRVDPPTLEELPETEDKKSGLFRSIFNGFVKDFNDRRAKRREETDAAIERAMGLSPKEQWKEIFDAVKRHWGIGKPEEFVPEASGSGRTDEDYARFFEGMSDDELAKLWMAFNTESDGVIVNPDAKEKIRAELERRGMSTDIDELVDAYGKDDVTLTGERMEDAIDLFIDDIDMDEVPIDIIDPFTPSEPRPAPRPRVPSGGRSPRPTPRPRPTPDALDPRNPPDRWTLPKRPDGISDADWRAYVRYHRSIRPEFQATGRGDGRGFWNLPATFEQWKRMRDGDSRPADAPNIPGYDPQPRRPANNRRPGKFPQELPELSDTAIGEFIDSIQNKIKKANYPTPLEDIKRAMGRMFGKYDISQLTSEELEELAAWAKQKGKDIKNGKYPRDWENSQGQTFTRFASSILDVRDARNELINRGATPDENGRVHKPNWDRVNENWRDRVNREREIRIEDWQLQREERERDQEGQVFRGRGNLRESEARRMARELREPGAPRTGETPRARTRGASDAGATRTATRRTPATAEGDANIPSKPVTPTRRTVKPKKIKDPNKLSDNEILNEVANPETDQTMVAALTDEFNRRNSRVSLKPSLKRGNVALPVDRAFDREEMQEIIGGDPELAELLAQNDPNNPNWSIQLDQAMESWNANNLEEMGQVIARHEEMIVEDATRLERFVTQLNDAETPAQVKMAREMIAIVNAQYAEHRKALSKLNRRKTEIEGQPKTRVPKEGTRAARRLNPQRVNAKDLNLEKGHTEIEMMLDATNTKLSDLDREMEQVAQFGGEEGLFKLAEKYEFEAEKLTPLFDQLERAIENGEGNDVLEFDMSDFNGYEGEQTIQEYRDNVFQIMVNNQEARRRVGEKIANDRVRGQADNQYKKEQVAQITDGGIIEPELRPAKVDRITAPRQNPEDPNSPFLYNETNINEAIKHIHDDGGSLDDIPDEIVFDAIVDGELRQYNMGDPYDMDEVLADGFGGANQWENKRFRFEILADKTTEDTGGLWQVVKVYDKVSRKEYYMKKSYYARNEAVLEMVGARAGEILEFPNHPNKVRVDRLRQMQNLNDNGRFARWIITESSQDWDIGAGTSPSSIGNTPQDAANVRAIDIEERDVARMAVLDLVLHNQDRHPGNWQIVTDERGRQRFIPLDHGMLGGGRVGNFDDMDEDITPRDLNNWADETIDEFEANGIDMFDGMWAVHNNGLHYANQYYQHDDRFPEQRARFLAVVRNATNKLEQEFDNMFDFDRIQENGVELSELEKAHLVALKRVARHRLDWLKQNPEALVAYFD